MEPAAHMYPSDLERFEASETFAHAYSVAVGNPDERSVPLYKLSDVAPLQTRLADALAALQKIETTCGDECFEYRRIALEALAADERVYGA